MESLSQSGAQIPILQAAHHPLVPSHTGASLPQPPKITVSRCYATLTLPQQLLNRESVSRGAMLSLAPYFLSISAPWSIAVSDTHVRGSLGKVGSGASYSFEGCTFGTDDRVVGCLGVPLKASQQGIR